MRDELFQVTETLNAATTGDEWWTIWYDAEQTDFARFTGGRVRQAGHVEQIEARLDYALDGRHGSASFTLGTTTNRSQQVLDVLNTLRLSVRELPQDPHYQPCTVPWEVTLSDESAPVDGQEVTQAVVDASEGLDLVGILANGPTIRAFASSAGHRLYTHRYSTHLDYSIVEQADRAAKGSYATKTYDRDQLVSNIQRTANQLDLLRRPQKRIEPGLYRVFFAPAALQTILELLSWGGFSARERSTKQSPLQRLHENSCSLSEAVSLTENTEAGLTPPFQEQGYRCPPSVPLVTDGRAHQALVSPRSARAFDLDSNGANDSEVPCALEMAAGTLASDNVLEALDTGLYVNNLWYLNYSDRNACRITGMTRFATFWVERGKVVAPVSVMRFDDTIYRILGSKLLALTQEREFRPSADTYFRRSTTSMTIPGALVDEFQLTL